MQSTTTQIETSTQHEHQNRNIWLLALAALGIVFGDIGTSPLYAFRECFSSEIGLSLNHANVLGILSLIFWTLILVICIKYMFVVMRADNKGEGGILSLMALAMRSIPQGPSSKRRWVILTLGLFGAALLYGDGAITPAISVLSAVEGLSYITPVFNSYVIPLTLVVLAALFAMQRYGTGRIGVVFGPIILIWFVVLAALGIRGIQMNPEILVALNPIYAVDFFISNGWQAAHVLGSVFLVVTGGEALYADMGHFGRTSIQRAWFIIVLPSLVINYFGQGSILLLDASNITNPFYLMVPKWLLAPLVILSTIATVIASQALISGVFSITRQAVQLGFFPRISIIHTSSKEIGQIFVPFINWALFVAVVWLILNFKTSSNLAAAYGIAVTMTMVITTILAFFVATEKWKWSLPQAFIIFGLFLIMDISFMGANIIKIESGGWVPLALGIVIYLLMTTWQQGRKILYSRLKERSVSVEEFCQRILKNPPMRVPGTAIYMSGDPWGVPVPLLHILKHNKVMHERVALLTILTKEVPLVPKKERVHIQEIVPNLYRIIVFYGFMEIPKMKHILDALRSQDIHFKLSDTTFVLGRETIIPSSHPGMSLWRESLFAWMTKNAQRPTTFFRIPPNQVIEVGIQVEI